MSPDQHARALRLADVLDSFYQREVLETASFLRELAAEPVRVPMTWQPIETAPKGRIVLVYYTNDCGRGRTMRARYYLPETLESEVNESGWCDEGWYEESEAYEYLMPLEHDPTHWMPLPDAPHGITGDAK